MGIAELLHVDIDYCGHYCVPRRGRTQFANKNLGFIDKVVMNTMDAQGF